MYQEVRDDIYEALSLLDMHQMDVYYKGMDVGDLWNAAEKAAKRNEACLKVIKIENKISNFEQEIYDLKLELTDAQYEAANQED